MKKKYNLVSVNSAEAIAKIYNKQEIVILAIDRVNDKVDITTYGINRRACKSAEITGDFLAEVLQINDPDVFFELIEKMKKAYLERRGK